MITRARLIARSWTDGKYRNALDAWDIRSWPVPWRQLLLIMVRASLLCSTNLNLSLLVVQTIRVWYPGCRFLLRRNCVRGVWRFTGGKSRPDLYPKSVLTYISGCHIKHGRDRWKTSLGLDFVRYTLFFSERFTNISFSILEGLITVVAGIASFWIIQDFPDTAKFLSEEERTVVVRRLQGDDQF